MSRPNGLIGGITNVYLRRLALVTVALPLTFFGLAPAYLRVFPSALAEAWDAFAGFYRRPNTLNSVAWKAAWSKDWKPAQ